jgi:hypothetical protein
MRTAAIGDFIFDSIGWILFGLFVLASVALFVGVKSDWHAQDAFMADCLKERKAYECTAMWRAGDSHVAPIPIVIPVR